MQLQNENKLDEMSIILQNIMTLVPSLPSENEVEHSDGGKINYDCTNFFKIPLGGDQLMVVELNAFFVVLTRQWNIYRVLSQYKRTGMQGYTL